MAQPILSVRDLRVSVDIGGLPPVRGVSLSLDRGGSRAVVGSSGGGKTLTALAIMGLLPTGLSSSGRVFFDGRELDARTVGDVRGRGISMVFQDPGPSLNPALTVGRQIEDVLRRHHQVDRRTARSRAIDWIERVGLDNPSLRVDEHAHQLSGGQQQRIAIAIALAGEPEVLIADEPTSSLDLTVQSDIVGLLESLRIDRELALLFITHDLRLARRIANDVTVLDAGQVVEEGDLQEVLESPRSDAARALIEAVS